MTKLYPLLLFSLLCLAGCKSAGKAYHNGDYADAVELGVKKLQKDPSDEETREIVQNAYQFAIQGGENRIRTLSSSMSDDRFEKIYQEYRYMQDLHLTVQAYPVPARMIKTQDYSGYIETYRQRIIEVYSSRAAAWKDGTRDGYRQAYREYNNALRYSPQDIELKRKRDSAYEAAVIKVMVVPVQHYNGYQYAGYYGVRRFQDNIMRALTNNMNNEFVRFYPEWETRSREIIPDQVMELNISRIQIGQPYDSRSSREVSKEVVVKEIVYKPDSVVKQYGRVKAKITTTKRTLLSEGDLVITLRDTNGRMIWTDRFTGHHEWKTEFATYTGDDRALSESDRKALDRDQPDAPGQEAVLEELFRQIQNDLYYRLRNYYNR